MTGQVQFRNEDLVLEISTSVDPTKFNIDHYEAFIDALCGTREYQKEAIRIILRYFLGGKYNNLWQLAQENFDKNRSLQDRYGSFKKMKNHLQIPDKLSCSIDLATATGKSYVMYGVAQIMLAHGAVDRVLVLCPSLTIEKGLTGKFRTLSTDATLKDLLPADSKIFNPHIINATESLVNGTICIENFHATLQHVKSSIRDSLSGKGKRTLILNDEAHHIYSSVGKELKRWKEFLLSDDFDFHYIAGFSGTCYIGNEYFTDVITRYSLRQAIENGYAKVIDYVDEDTSITKDEKFQKIYDNHTQNKTQFYRKSKPITILIARNIASCKRLTEDLIQLLSRHEGIPVDDVKKKVLIITSNKEHQANVRELEEVDRYDHDVEWITSVSMLTEGWDVKNVFQIVPHEERAFNSKLLIAQVLGRGLRIPEEYKGERPVVTVFNHDAWSGRIKHLVDEVMEIEKRVYSGPATKDPDYHFDLHNINYDNTQDVEKFKQTEEYEFSKGYVKLVAQTEVLERETTYARATTGDRRLKKTLVLYQMYSVDEVAEHIHAKFMAIDLEEGTNYADKYSFEWLQDLIRESLKRVGEKKEQVSEENRQRLQKAFGVVHRKAAHTVRYKMSPSAIVKINTKDRNRNSVGYNTIRRGEATIFMDDNSVDLSDDETRIVLKEIVDDVMLPRIAFEKINNTFLFKTPLNVVIANHKPEYNFVRHLVDADNAAAVDSWVKSTDHDFYSIDYSWRKGEHAKRSSFSPDFFIKIDDHIIVVEIKGDEELSEPSDENRAKFKAATRHYKTLNEQQDELKYHFHFLTPSNYDIFFKYLRDKNVDFVSNLDADLDNGAI
jgi:type III restriction enzyme